MKHIFLLLAPIAMQAANNSPGKQPVIEQAAAAAERLWNQLSAVNCLETVEQQKLAANGKVMVRQSQSFDYLAILQVMGSDILVDESRAAVGKAEPRKDQPLLITNGFAMFAFIFHPFYQGAFEYSTPQAVRAAGKDLLLVRFRHVNGTRSPSVLKLKKREYPLAWEGTAWIDPVSGFITRVAASLETNMEDAGLKTLTADVRYTPVIFKEDAEPYWLPSVVRVEVETPRQHWRNLHTFTRYRLFSVGVKSEVGAPQ